MRRPALTVTAAALTAALLLAACGSEADDDGTDPAAGDATQTTDPADDSAAPQDPAAPEEQPANAPEDVAALEAVTVEGEAGSAPTLSFDQPFTVSGPAAILVESGDGAAITSEHLLVVDFVQVDGVDGVESYSTYDATAETMMLDNLVSAVSDLLDGQGVGTRVLFAAPGAESSMLMALEVSDVRELRADGSPVDLPEGLPTVTRAETGEPSIEPAGGDAPEELIVEPVLQGEGKAIEEGDHVIVQYSGWLWDGEPFDSSWSRPDPFTLQAGAGQVIEGWDTGLLGQTVGSQVLFVIPPELGYGDSDQGSIPPNSTLVFVVDIIFAG